MRHFVISAAQALSTLAVFASLAVSSGARAEPPPNHPSADEAARHMNLPRNVEGLRYRGHVLEAFDSNNYTYIRAATEQGEIWLAAPRIELAAGSDIRFGDGRQVRDFFSRKHHRLFETLTFIDRVELVK
jgi:hypothetical protein